ncbi:MAG: hypothetical protein ACI9W6_002810 [Motiliproteus sp.]|jgi:hypothetical protein
MSPRLLITGILGLIAFLSLGIGGYFLFVEMKAVHKQNTEELAGFGGKVIPRTLTDDGASYGLVDGAMQLPPTIQEKKLSPTEKVILSLSRDKDLLQIEAAEITEKLKRQQGRLQELRAYKTENERFAPLLLTQERQNAVALIEKRLNEQFANTPDIEHFNAFQRKAMTLATANLYTDIKRQQPFIKDDPTYVELLNLLPEFSVCLGKGIPYITNSQTEESIVIQALSAGDQRLITGRLADDFKATYDPCLKRFNRELNRQVIQQGPRTQAPDSSIDSNIGSDAPALELTSAAQSSEPSANTIDLSLSPTKQLIQSLGKGKETALKQAQRLKQQLVRQTQEIAELKRYQDTTERFAPLPTLEERNRAQKRLLAYLEESQDARRFNRFEKQAMSYAAANHYAGFSTRQRLVLNETIKDQIIQDLLPRFGFCYGDGLKFIIDNHQQERQLINYLNKQDREYMDIPLAQKVTTIAQPCEKELDLQFSAFY